MSDSQEQSIVRLQEAVKNLVEKEAEHHKIVLDELKDIKENINPRLVVLETKIYSKGDFSEFYRTYVIEQNKQDTRIEKLEKRFIYYLGAGAVIVVLGLGVWQLLLPIASSRLGNTTNINTTSK